MKIICNCGGWQFPYPKQTHTRQCPTATAFRHRCPACKTRKVKGYVRHSAHCALKEVQSP